MFGNTEYHSNGLQHQGMVKEKIKSITVDKRISESITVKHSCTGMCVYAVFNTNWLDAIKYFTENTSS